MKRILLIIAGLLAAAFSLSAQQTRDTEWFIGAGGGVNIGFDGKNHDNANRAFSYEGAGTAIDVYIGKYFKEWIGFRAGWQGYSISDEKTNYGKSKFNYGHADLLFRPVSFFVPYIHAGYAHIDKGSLGLGAGVMLPVNLGKVVTIVPDVKYTGMSGKVFENSTSKLNHNVSVTLGLAFRFGGKNNKAKKGSGDEGSGNEGTLAPPDTTSSAAPAPDTAAAATEQPKDTVASPVEPPKDTVAAVTEPKDTVAAAPAEDKDANEHKKVFEEFGNTYFEYNSANLKTESSNNLDIIVEYMKQHPEVRAMLAGHADEIGNRWFNKALSEQRCLAVLEYLTSKGIERDRIEYVGYGEDRPLDTGTTEESYKKNRCVEVSFLEAEK